MPTRKSSIAERGPDTRAAARGTTTILLSRLLLNEQLLEQVSMCWQQANVEESQTMTNSTGRQTRLAKRMSRSRKFRQLTADEQRRRLVQADIARQLRRWPPRRIAAWSLFLLAAVIAVQHLLAHGGVRPVPLSMGWQDLLMGYPMAAVVFILGAFIIEARRGD